MTGALPYPALAGAEAFSPLSRVWIYVADRDLSAQEKEAVQGHLDIFCRQWTAHNLALRARGEVFAGRVLLLMVDETQAGASGCSIDKSVHFLEALGAELQVDWFDRMQFGWVSQDGAVRLVSKAVFEEKIKTGEIGPETPVLNTLADTKDALRNNLWTPFQESWQKRLF